MSLLVGLVDDPQCIIRTANFHKDLCIVWASYKGSTADLAKFTVIALSNPNDCKQYSTRVSYCIKVTNSITFMKFKLINNFRYII